MTSATSKSRCVGIALFAVTLVGAGAASRGAQPARQPASLPVPTEAEIMEMMKRNMGKPRVRSPETTSDGVQVVLQTGHSSQITAVALSADGRYIISGGMDETAKVWDVASGQEARTISGFDSLGPRTVAFSNDGARAIIADLTSIKVYDVASGHELRTVSNNATMPMISGDGRYCVCATNDMSSRLRGASIVDLGTRIVDINTGATVRSVPTEPSESAVAISGDGTTLLTRRVDAKAMSKAASGEIISDLRVWDVTSGKLIRKLPASVGRLGPLTALSPDGKLLLTESITTDGSLAVFDIVTGQKLLTLQTDSTVMRGMTDTLTFSPDGHMVAWATSSDAARVWNIPSGKLIVSLQASALGFSADGKRLVVGRGTGGAPVVRDIARGDEFALAGGASGIADLALTADGRSAVSAMNNGGAKLWDLTTGQMVRTYDCPSGAGASSVAVSATPAPVIATGCMDGSAWLWDLASGRQIRNLVPALPAHQFAFTLVRFSRDGRVLALGVNSQVSLWDVASGQEIRRVMLPDVALPEMMGLMMEKAQADNVLDSAAVEQGLQAVHAIALHPDGELLAIGRTYQVALWNLRTGELVRIVSGSGAARQISPAAQPAAAAGSAAKDQGKEQSKGKRANPATAGMPALESMLKSMRGMGGGAPQGVIAMSDPSELLDAMEAQTEGSRALTFSRDGRLLLMLGNHGPRVWDVASGQEVRPPKPQSAASPLAPGELVSSMMDREIVAGEGSAFSPDGRLGARGHGRVVRVWDIATGEDTAEFLGHTSDVSSLAFTADGRSLVSGGRDGAIRVWNLAARKESVALIALGATDFVAVTPDQYYRASKSRIKGVAFRANNQLYPFEQFDLRFNRPDIVLERLGTAPPELVQSYRHAYQRRLKKMGFTETMLGTDFRLPQAEILTHDVPLSTENASLSLRVRAHDEQFTLDRLNVYVNDVPVYGTAGLPLPDKQAHEAQQEIKVPLVAGRNKIQVSVLNRQGTESLRQTVYTNAIGAAQASDTYMVAIGVSHYANSRYNLRYAAKDADDLARAYEGLGQRPTEHGQVHVLRLTDDKATRTQIHQAKEWLAQAKVSDLVVVFAAGHGMTDSQSNYYFGTYDIDPQQPGAKGLPYEEFEALLDGIPSLQKVLLLDTCFSGEIDTDDQVVVAQADSSGAGTVKMRAFKAARGVSVQADTSGVSDGSGAGAPATAALPGDMLRFQQDWFADLRRGTGAAVISSSSGNEYSLEGEQWSNGVFTYALLQGLKNGQADANKDHVITVSELQAYVIDEVRKLTQGGQNPTARRENLEYDFPVY